MCNSGAPFFISLSRKLRASWSSVGWPNFILFMEILLDPLAQEAVPRFLGFAESPISADPKSGFTPHFSRKRSANRAD